MLLLSTSFPHFYVLIFINIKHNPNYVFTPDVTQKKYLSITMLPNAELAYHSCMKTLSSWLKHHIPPLVDRCDASNTQMIEHLVSSSAEKCRFD